MTTVKYLLVSLSYLVIMSFTICQPLSLVMPMTEERLLTLGTHKMLKNKKKLVYTIRFRHLL